MKLIQTCSIFLLSFIVTSQNQPSFEIEFSGRIYFDSSSDSIKYYNWINQYEIDEYLFYQVEKQIAYIKTDTILVEEFPKQNESSKTIFIRSSGRNDRMDLDSGVKTKWNHPYVIKKYRKVSNYNRISNEDKIILGLPCEAWVSKSKNGWNKIWVSKKRLESSQLEYPDIIVDGFLVLKNTLHINDIINIDFEAKSIKQADNSNFKSILDEHLKIDIKEKFLPLNENKSLSVKPIKVGIQIDNYALRSVLKMT